MAAEPTLEPTAIQEEVEEQIDEEEESDVYDSQDEEGGSYELGENENEDEDEDEDGDEELGGDGPKNMTALLLGEQNGTARAEYDEEEEEEEEEDDEYHDEGTVKNPIDLSSTAGGLKRGAEELSEGDADGDEDDDEAEEQTVAKKARV